MSRDGVQLMCLVDLVGVGGFGLGLFNPHVRPLPVAVPVIMEIKDLISNI